MVEKRVKKFGQGPLPPSPHFGQCPKEIDFFYGRCSLIQYFVFPKVVYFTATFPYVLLVAITAYGLTLDGAWEGVKELFVPKSWWGPKTITDPQVWRKAAEQMFYSLSVSLCYFLSL